MNWSLKDSIDMERRVIRYETDTRYYEILLQEDLFGTWAVFKTYGSKTSKLGGVKIDLGLSYAIALKRIEALEKRRLYRGYKKIKRES